MATEISKMFKDGFINLYCQMSPENLTCDGELSRAQVNIRMTKIRKLWKILENMVGRKVAMEEAAAWAFGCPQN